MKYEKKIKEMLKGSEESFLLVTKNGTATVGYNYEILTLLTMLVKDVKKCEGITEENIDKVFELSKMSEDELTKGALKKLKELIEKMGE